MFLPPRVTSDSGHKVLDHLTVSSVGYTRVPYRAVSLCLNSTNKGKFPAQGHARFLRGCCCCSVVCYSAPEISPVLLCNCEWVLFQFFQSVGMGVVSSGLLNHWKGRTLRNTWALDQELRSKIMWWWDFSGLSSTSSDRQVTFKRPQEGKVT